VFIGPSFLNHSMLSQLLKRNAKAVKGVFWVSQHNLKLSMTTMIFIEFTDHWHQSCRCLSTHGHTPFNAYSPNCNSQYYPVFSPSANKWAS